jgi:hypothetical protein
MHTIIYTINLVIRVTSIRGLGSCATLPVHYIEQYTGIYTRNIAKIARRLKWKDCSLVLFLLSQLPQSLFKFYRIYKTYQSDIMLYIEIYHYTYLILTYSINITVSTFAFGKNK